MHHCRQGRHAHAAGWGESIRMRRHERDHGMGARRGRVFEHGDLRYVLLKLISEKPSHGYQLIKAIEERLGGAYSPSPGVIYPTLTLLEDLGYVAAVEAEGAKKAFAITEEGRAALETHKSTVEAIFARIDAVAGRMGGGPAPQIIRAMENLRLALRLRLERGKLSEAQVAAIAHALDTAAQVVERD